MNRCAGILLLAWAPYTIAQTVPSVDPALRDAQSAGYWESGDSRGGYRILVFSGGYEHISNWVVAEWIAEPTDNYSDSTIVHAKQLVGPGFFVFDMPVITEHDGHPRVELQGADTHNPERKVSCVFDLLPDGEAKQVKACD